MLEVAMDGNPRCLEFFMDRPPRRGRVLEQQLPKISGVNDIAPAMAAITTQLNNGELATEEASELIDFMERFARVILATGLVERVEKIEAQLNQMKMLSANRETIL
jgi:ethanolamine utilization microcompartment shell protein EutS